MSISLGRGLPGSFLIRLLTAHVKKNPIVPQLILSSAVTCGFYYYVKDSLYGIFSKGGIYETYLPHFLAVIGVYAGIMLAFFGILFGWATGNSHSSLDPESSITRLNYVQDIMTLVMLNVVLSTLLIPAVFVLPYYPEKISLILVFVFVVSYVSAQTFEIFDQVYFAAKDAIHGAKQDIRKYQSKRRQTEAEQNNIAINEQHKELSEKN